MRLAAFALLAALPAGAQAQTVPSTAAAHDFVVRLYEGYHHGEPAYLDRDAPKALTPALIQLIRREQAATDPGEVGVLDFDPICDCQDPSGLRVPTVVITPTGPGQARARATWKAPSETQAITLDLAVVHGAWRVADIHSKDDPSFVGLLKTAAAERARPRKRRP